VVAPAERVEAGLRARSHEHIDVAATGQQEWDQLPPDEIVAPVAK
jgi:hypothetical protein